MTRLDVSRSVAAWSDGRGYNQAVDLAQKHACLFGGPLSSAQLAGFLNATWAASKPAEVLRFVNAQGQRASKREQPDLRRFWQEVASSLNALAKTASELSSGQAVATTAAGTADVEVIHLHMIRRFVQHLVVHGLYLQQPSPSRTPQGKGASGRRN